MKVQTDKQEPMNTSAKRGRPRNFDENQVLVRARDIFYEKGFEGTSLDDLTRAMGLNRPSLYAAFGNKEQLYVQAMQLHMEHHHGYMRDTLFSESNVYEGFSKFLGGLGARSEELGNDNKGAMLGCMLVNSTILSCRDQAGIDNLIGNFHQEKENILSSRLLQGVNDRQLLPNTDVKALAQYFNGVIQGIAVLSRAQQSHEVMRNISRLSLKLFDDLLV